MRKTKFFEASRSGDRKRTRDSAHLHKGGPVGNIFPFEPYAVRKRAGSNGLPTVSATETISCTTRSGFSVCMVKFLSRSTCSHPVMGVALRS
jgi:hypothetical protein